jgi:uncharacterized protein
MGSGSTLRSVDAARYTDEKFGLPTVRDILKELEKPGRDPRPEFKTAEFKEGVESLADLKPGMQLEGVVTNVTNFGAFVDVGVHQDGLVHISMLANRFVKDPREVVKAGDVVQVKVMEVDVPRKRIALTMRLGDTPQAAAARAGGEGRSNERTAGRDERGRGGGREQAWQGARANAPRNEPTGNGLMADALRSALGRK